MSKKCINCKADLPDNASFCPHCATSQLEKQTIKTPKLWRKKAFILLTAVVLVIIAALAVRMYHAPQTYEGGAEVIYTDKDGTYHILLNFSAADGVIKQPAPEVSLELPPGDVGGIPSQLYIYREDTEAVVWEEFLDKVKSCTVEAVAMDGAHQLSTTRPVHVTDFPYVAMTSDIGYSAECGTNEVVWTLHMKNGDTIIVKHSIHVIPQNSLNYYPEDVAMDTLDELQALLTAIETEVDPETVVNLYLPPVTYEGGITMTNRTFNLYGGSDGENRTTFQGTVTVQTREPQLTQICGICFLGDGGTGLSATEGVLLRDCVFSGWEIGASAQNGSWIGAVNCSFEKNEVGLLFDSGYATCSAPAYRGNTFQENGTALLIKEMPSTEWLSFPECIFAGNDIDIENPAEHPLDTSEAIFE